MLRFLNSLLALNLEFKCWVWATRSRCDLLDSSPHPVPCPAISERIKLVDDRRPVAKISALRHTGAKITYRLESVSHRGKDYIGLRIQSVVRTG